MAGLFGNPVPLLDSSGMLSTPSKSAPRVGLETPLSASRAKPGRGAEKQKGLKLFSTKVCEKVRQKQRTTYNEVADELVTEVAQERQEMSGEPMYDQKNIRRRVYDALNVLMAIEIIAKEKKEIRWIGLPTNSASECQQMEADQQAIKERIARKRRELQDLLLQQIAFSNIVSRNRAQASEANTAAPNSSVRLPFVLLKTNKATTIECSISSDRTEYSFDFDQPFEIYSDADVLHLMRMSMGLADQTCTPEELEKARQLVPKRFVEFIDDMYENGRQPVAPGEVDAGIANGADLGSRMPVTMSVHQTFGGNAMSSFGRSLNSLSSSLSHPEQPLAAANGSGVAGLVTSQQSSLGVPLLEQGCSSQGSTLSESSPSPEGDLEDENESEAEADFDVASFDVVVKQELPP